MSGKSFSVWLNNDYLPNHQEYSWIREVSSKSVKHSIGDACTAFSRFFHHQSGFPRYKKKGRSDVKIYFVRNNPKDCLCERHRIKIPTLGWVRLKEKGYIPTAKDGYIVKSGTVLAAVRSNLQRYAKDLVSWPVRNDKRCGPYLKDSGIVRKSWNETHPGGLSGFYKQQ